MKNIVHTLTLAQMRANPRRTLVTLVGVVLSVTMLTAVFAGADSFFESSVPTGSTGQRHLAWQSL